VDSNECASSFSQPPPLGIISNVRLSTGTILDMMAQDRERAKQARLVENQIVLTNYADRRGDRRFYRVAKIDWDKSKYWLFSLCLLERPLTASLPRQHQ
jgi:hypothetical protein